MSRAIASIILITTMSCADDGATTTSAGNVRTPTASVSTTTTMPCPSGSECPEFIPCDELDEAQCASRSDCEIVYDPTSTTPRFLACENKTAPVCAAEGKSCSSSATTDAPCCPGLYCCGGTPIETGQEVCTAGACPVSDRTQKHDIVPVDPDAVLDKLATLPVATWTYNFEAGVRHMGPMAQDFAAAFAIGATNRRIFTVDADGVALASIQALLHRIERLQGANAELERDNAELRNAFRVLDQRTRRLEHRSHW